MSPPWAAASGADGSAPAHLPAVTSGCVHVRSPLATCTSCLEACPRDALDLSPRGVTVDGDVCDGCGICAAACPEAAIDLPDPPRAYQPQSSAPVAFAACCRVVAAGERGHVPCLHALGLRELSALAGSGVETLHVAAAPCADCPCNPGDRLSEAAGHLERLHQHRARSLRIVIKEPRAWREARDDAARIDRRGLLRAFIPRHLTATSDDAATNDSRTTRPVCDSDAVIAQFAPLVDADRCTACNACVKLCAHEAIVLREADGDGPDRYVVAPQRCTGCELCQDACSEKALRVVQWPQIASADLVLVASQCVSCGNSYREPAARQDRSALCHVCRSNRARAKLFQVLP